MRWKWKAREGKEEEEEEEEGEEKAFTRTLTPALKFSGRAGEGHTLEFSTGATSPPEKNPVGRDDRSLPG
jgi:hypothetical protein